SRRRVLSRRSKRSSCEEFSVRVAWTWTNPCFTRSPSSTRTTPTGVRVSAETSATERESQTPTILPWRSSPQPRRVAEVSSRSVASSGRSTAGRVRPAVRAYGRTIRAAGGLVLSSRSSDIPFPLHPVHPGLGLDHLTDTLDEEGHLVAHLADVGSGLGQHRQVRPVAHAHQEHEA